jgi:hypothetical protein
MCFENGRNPLDRAQLSEGADAKVSEGCCIKRPVRSPSDYLPYTTISCCIQKESTGSAFLLFFGLSKVGRRLCAWCGSFLISSHNLLFRRGTRPLNDFAEKRGGGVAGSRPKP